MKWPDNLERGPRTSGRKKGHNTGKKKARIQARKERAYARGAERPKEA